MSDWQQEQYDPRRHAQRIAQPPPWEAAQNAPYGQSGQSGQMPPAYQQPQYQPQYAPPQPPHAPAPPRAPTAPPVNARRRRPLLGCLALVVLAGVAVIIIAVATSGGSGGSFKTAVSYTVNNPADLAVAVHDTNTGKTAATPTCTVSASDPSGAYTGFDEGTLDNPVPAGQTVTYVDNVTITGQGAQYVTSVTVSC